ncbi:MAG: methyltransferase domain-containing protein [Acidobacteria bacterium]|nr:methyltransferase domain-containing protein [Acidobacteriota bacterium]
MKEAALGFLMCPECSGSLRLEVRERAGDEIILGDLDCGCGKRYPIEEGIAQFMSQDYTASFSFQWFAQRDSPENATRSRRVKEDFLKCLGVEAEELKGKRVLDAGCGRGTLTEVLSDHAAEVVGIDLSDGVRVAASRTRGKAGVSILRGDILNLPLAEESFDGIFSTGVLHHTRDCKAAFLTLAQRLRPGGILGIWVYSAYSTYRNKASDFLRRFTIRMPPRLLYLLCHLAIPLYYLQKIPVLGVPFRVIPIAGEGPWRWKILGTYDWYSPTYQSKHSFPEVFGWFAEAGLEKIQVHDWNICVSGRRPRP